MSTAALLTLLACAAAALRDDDQRLSRFRRTEGPLTRVRIGAPVSSAPKIDPRLFGNFLEHLGGTIYEGLWANVVYNPQLDSDPRGGLVRWKLADGATAEPDGKQGQCVRLPANGELSQLISLPAHRERRYRGSLWLRRAGEQPSMLHVIVQRAGRRNEPLGSVTVVPAGDGWRRYRLELEIAEGALARGEAAELRITVEGGTLEVDDIVLFPADAVALSPSPPGPLSHAVGEGEAGVIDPEVLAATKALRIPLLRWPGGNFASGYHWRDGIGPRELRPTRKNPAWAGLETHHFGTDEFMAFCRLIASAPQICVNAGDGTPEEAADWVEYCNGPATSPMGRLRAANGHPAPYNVRVWEIGNELYGNWQIGHTDPEGNAERFVRFRRAMLAKDPTIEVIATGRGDLFTEPGVSDERTWNRALLSAAQTAPLSPNSGGLSSRAPQHLSLHPLVPLPGDLNGKPFDDVYASTMAHPQWVEQTLLPAVREDLDGARTRVAITEWGIILGGPAWLRYPNHDSQCGAVYAALFYHAMLRSAGLIDIANTTALLHGGGIRRHNGVTWLLPMYHVGRMYGSARPTRLLPVTVEGPGFDVPQRGFLPAESDVPWLDVLAAETAGGVAIWVVNRDPALPREAVIELPHEAGELQIETLAGEPLQRNTLERPDAVRPTRETIRASGKTVRRAFPPCSVTEIVLLSPKQERAPQRRE